MSKLVICVAVYDEDNRILIGERHPGKDRGGLWEFPGGKVEPGEDPVQAAIREWKEELGLKFERSPNVIDLIRMPDAPESLIALAEAPITLGFEHQSVRMDGVSHTKVDWIYPHRLQLYTFTPSTALLIKRNYTRLTSGRWQGRFR